MATTETRRMVLAAAEACEDKKAEDTRILELDTMDAGFTDFFLISSGSNERQTQAIADEIENAPEAGFSNLPQLRGGPAAGRMDIDGLCGFRCPHLSHRKRTYYDIERLRKSARTVDLEQLKAMLVEKTVVARSKPAKKVTVQKTAKKAVVKKTAVKKATAGRKSAVRKAAKRPR
jgi:ribosome-associated protein